MVTHQLFEVFSRLLQLQHEDDRLLRPVARLQQVVGFEDCFVCSVWEPLEHGRRIEEPQGASRHHVEAEGPKNRKVHGCIHLLHKPALLVSAPNACTRRQRPDEPLHKELACEAEHNGVKGDKGDIVWALAIQRRAILLIRKRIKRVSVARGQGVGEKDGPVNGIGFGRVNGIGGEDNQDEDERIYPGMFE